MKRNQLLSNYVLLVFVQFKVYKDLLGPKLFDVMPPAVKIRMQSMLCYLLGISMLGTDSKNQNGNLRWHLP